MRPAHTTTHTHTHTMSSRERERERERETYAFGSHMQDAKFVVRIHKVHWCSFTAQFQDLRPFALFRSLQHYGVVRQMPRTRCAFEQENQNHANSNAENNNGRHQGKEAHVRPTGHSQQLVVRILRVWVIGSVHHNGRLRGGLRQDFLTCTRRE
jgi:hypothetical protein